MHLLKKLFPGSYKPNPSPPSPVESPHLFEQPLDTGIDLTTASNLQILYRNPLGKKGYFTATVAQNTTTLVNSLLSYNIGNTDLSVPGVWEFQASATLSGQNQLGAVSSLPVNASLK